MSRSSLANVCCPKHPDLPLIEDHHAGDMVCPGCGMVVGNRVIDPSQEWRTFGDGNADPSRVGASENPLLDGDNLCTIIGSATGPAGLDQYGNNKYRNRQMMSNENKSLSAAFNFIDESGSKGRFTRSITEQAKVIFKETYEKTKDRNGKNRIAIAAAALFMACRDENSGRSYKELSAITGITVKRISKAICYIEDVRGKRVEAQTCTEFMESFLPRFSSSLNFTSEHVRVITYVATKANDLGFTLGRSHLSVAGGATYLTNLLFNLRKSAKEIAEAAGTAETTLKQVYKILYSHIHELLPPDLKTPVAIEQLPAS